MEKETEKYLVKSIEKYGGWCIKFPPIFLAGFPDRIVLMPGGRIVFVETKAPGKAPRLIQIKLHNKLRLLGFRVEVIDGREGVDNFILSL